MSFPTGGKYPFKVTSGVRVLPDTLPYFRIAHRAEVSV